MTSLAAELSAQAETCRAALLTPPGTAGIATIGLQGARRSAVLETLFRPASGKRRGDLQFGVIFEQDETIDEVIVSEDNAAETAEIHCHGGVRIVQRILMLLERAGVSLTDWRNLHLPASIEGEIAHCLPQMKTRFGVLALTAQAPGGLRAWTSTALARLQESDTALTEITTQAKGLLKTYDRARRLFDSTTVVVAGAPNVGKSTLVNALAGREQSLVADMAGTTRDWTEELTDIGGLPVRLIDTAGRRDSDDPLERDAIGRVEALLDQADLVLLLVEADGSEQEQIENQKRSLPDAKKVLPVVNKCDLRPSSQWFDDILYICARDDLHLGRLRETIAGFFDFNDVNPQNPMVFAPRQYQLLEELTHCTERKQANELLSRLLNDPPTAKSI